jgi:hypothetical protein
LNSTEYVAEALAYKRAKKKSSKHPPWYMLCDESLVGVKPLADHLGRSGTYQLIYQVYSATTHGTDVIAGKVFPGKGEGSVFDQLRYPKYCQIVTQQVMYYVEQLFPKFIEVAVPEKRDEYEQVMRSYRVHYAWVFTVDFDVA